VLRINALAQRFPQIMPFMKELDVEMKKMIYMKVQILEAKKSFSENLGVSWPGSFAGPTVGFAGNLGGSENPTGAAAAGIAFPLNVTGMRTYLGITSLIQSTINLAKSNGDLTILAEPELSARSGGTAQFLAGGQVPIQTAGALGTASISYKDYGIKLTIPPPTTRATSSPRCAPNSARSTSPLPSPIRRASSRAPPKPRSTSSRARPW
jgi:pilus assembly protein CpaC